MLLLSVYIAIIFFRWQQENKKIKRAIKQGVNIVNIGTDIKVAFSEVLIKNCSKNKKETDPRKLLGPTIAAVEKVVMDKMKLFGSAGQVKIKDVATGLLDGKTKIVKKITDIADGKVKIKDVASNLVDGLLDIIFPKKYIITTSSEQQHNIVIIRDEE